MTQQRFDRLYKRSVKVVYGTQEPTGIGPDIPFTVNNLDDDGLRVQFVFERSNRGTPDRGTLRIFNLPEKTRRAMKGDLEAQLRARRDIQSQTVDDVERARRLKTVADAYRVSVFAGYGGRNLELVFRGDMIDMTPEIRRAGVDTITEVKLGDTLLALRDGYLNQAFGTGATIENVIRGAAAASALDLGSSGEAFIAAVAPNAVLTKTQNGILARGRVGDTLTDYIDFFGAQWWVRDGKLEIVPQGGTLPDYAIVLRQGRDLLSYTEGSAYEDATGRALMVPGIAPGRGLILEDNGGRRLDRLGFRVNTTRVRGDSGGPAWWVDFEASGVDSRILDPNPEFVN
jgi:hypothetical protein